MSLRQKTVKGVFWSGIQNWGAGLIATLVLFVLARLLAKEEFGLVGIALVFILLIELVLKQGFGQALVQKDELEPKHLDTAFWTGLCLAIAMMIVGVAIAGVVAAVYEEPGLAPVIRWLSLSFPVGALGYTQEALLRRDLAFKGLAIRQLIAATGGGVVGIAMALWGCGVWSLVGQVLATGAVGSVVLWIACDWRPRLVFSRRHLQELWAFGVFAMGVSLLSFLTRRCDVLLIGYFLGKGPAGTYFVAFRLLAAMTQVFTQTVAAVGLPTFSRIQHQPEQLRNAFYTATQMTSLIAFPAFLGLAALAPELVPVLFGEGWDVSIPVVRFLALFGIIQALFHFTGLVILAKGKPSWRFGLGCLDALAQVVAVLIAVQWGIVAVAIACLVRITLTFPMFLAGVHKLIRLDFATYLYRLVTPVVGSLLMAVVVLGAKWLLVDSLSPMVLLACCVAIGVLVYSLFVVLLARSLARQTWDLLLLAVLPGGPEESSEGPV